MKTNKKVYVYTLGCPKNEADSEGIMGLLSEKGFEICFEAEEADVIVINTCAFVNDAKEESVEAVLEACEIKSGKPDTEIVVCGCLAQRYASELAEEIPEVDYFIGTGDFHKVADILSEDECDKIHLGSIDEPVHEMPRLTDEYTSYAYVKISEGCDKHCTYCIIPKLKGRHRSRPIDEIVKEVKYLASEGKTEIILVAQDTAAYGTDLYGERKLSELINKIAEIDKVHWIRLLYVYPEEVDEKLISVYRNCDKLVKYIDIPLQHVNDRILKKMNRKTSKSEIEALINKLREEIPNIAIRSTFITGFPSENEEDVAELDEFLEKAKLTRAGVFAYSKEENTPAAEMPEQIDEEEKILRRDRLMQTQMQVSEKLLSEFVGKSLEVVIEGEEDGLYVARSYMDSPDIDGVVYINTEEELEYYEYYNVKITDSTEYDLWGILE